MQLHCLHPRHGRPRNSPVSRVKRTARLGGHSAGIQTAPANPSGKQFGNLLRGCKSIGRRRESLKIVNQAKWGGGRNRSMADICPCSLACLRFGTFWQVGASENAFISERHGFIKRSEAGGNPARWRGRGNRYPLSHWMGGRKSNGGRRTGLLIDIQTSHNWRTGRDWSLTGTWICLPACLQVDNVLRYDAVAPIFACQRHGSIRRNEGGRPRREVGLLNFSDKCRRGRDRSVTGIPIRRPGCLSFRNVFLTGAIDSAFTSSRYGSIKIERSEAGGSPGRWRGCGNWRRKNHLLGD